LQFSLEDGYCSIGGGVWHCEIELKLHCSLTLRLGLWRSFSAVIVGLLSEALRWWDSCFGGSFPRNWGDYLDKKVN